MAQDKNYISVTMLGRFLSRLRQIFAPFNHTHLYAGSNSAGGAANSAVKLQTPRTINGINFDGTNNINVPAQSINPTYLANQNLNYMIQLGFYYGVAGNNCTNLPSGVDAFSLEVYRTDNNNIAQKLVSGNNTSERIYFRQRTGSEWSEWGHVYTSKYKPTPSDIGAASSSHTHYYSEIYNTPTSMKNPYQLSLNINGSNLIYDGSSSKSANINPGTIGAAYSSHSHSNATQSLNGFMSYSDKKKLDGIAESANYTIVDSALDYYSTNAIQNKAVYNALSGKSNTGHSHTYSSLTGTPTSMQNPYALTINYTNSNGYLTSYSYDGSSSKTINIDTSQSTSHTAIVTLYTSSWSSYAPYSQYVSLSDITSSDVPIVGLYFDTGTTVSSSTEKAHKKAASCITYIDTYNGYAYVYCVSQKPTTNFQLQFKW